MAFINERKTGRNTAFSGQGIADYEYYPVLILYIQQLIVQRFYLFPKYPYHPLEQWTNTSRYFLNEQVDYIPDMVYEILSFIIDEDGNIPPNEPTLTDNSGLRNEGRHIDLDMFITRSQPIKITQRKSCASFTDFYVI